MSYVFGEDVIFNNNTETFGNSFISGNINILGDLTAHSITCPSIVKTGGTSNQFLKADGSSDTTTYLTAATVGGTVDNIGGQIVVRSGTGGFSAGIVTATTFVGNGTIPVGGIIMWSGAVTSIPSGWAICDGTNSTPDLRNRFIVGASSGTGDATYPGLSAGASGGSADAILVSHSHTATSTSTVTDPGHRHRTNGQTAQQGAASPIGSGSIENGPLTSSSTTGITVSTSTTISTEGSSATNANLPPYYALAFIMRTS
jgi:hypothetical protein